ncbi:MAG: respiratory nitrate reductase subunit gamma [Flavobacteriales bacterium]|nr:respiratory nitrate reductase subunit gamma [Flavobacteriales bacterium]
MLDFLLFGAFPYVALIVFLIGSIYRYLHKGYQVSSLSSQFLEGKKLFLSSQFFHWGIVMLFLGHLIGFLVPSAVMAWNGSPVRLLILEFTAFGFALSSLLGLVLLIHRRITTKRIMIVSNKMDFVVYGVLLLQIVSGIGIAYFGRWGSNWFASVMTPYLRSIFALNPNVDLIAQLSTSNAMALLMVKVHITTAFLIIGIIPFTRFVHFLVAPIDYIWRRYQVVIWNWNNKEIRKSRDYFPGKSREFNNN